MTGSGPHIRIGEALIEEWSVECRATQASTVGSEIVRTHARGASR